LVCAEPNCSVVEDVALVTAGLMKLVLVTRLVPNSVAIAWPDGTPPTSEVVNVVSGPKRLPETIDVPSVNPVPVVALASGEVS